MEQQGVGSESKEKASKPKRPAKSLFNKRATRMVKVAMLQRDLSFKELARLLEQSNPGSGHTAESLTNRINRGTFTAAFLVELSDALKAELQIVQR